MDKLDIGMVLEHTDYSYKSTYDSVSFGYPAVGGMMTWIDLPNTSNNAVEHHLTQAGICKRMVSFSKDTNGSCRGSRRDYWYTYAIPILSGSGIMSPHATFAYCTSLPGINCIALDIDGCQWTHGSRLIMTICTYKVKLC